MTGYKTAAGGNYHAFRWKGGKFVDLGVLPGFAHSFGWAINALGQVTGNSTSASGNSERFFRSIAGGGLQNLGGTGEHNVAWGINASGNVVGTRGSSQKRAVLYTDAGGAARPQHTYRSVAGLGPAGRPRHQRCRTDRRLRVQQFHGEDARGAAAARDNAATRVHFQLLRSTAIGLSAKTIGSNATVTAKVTVRDEKGLPMANALVVGRWTLPDGTEFQPIYAWTNQRGIATFVVTGTRPGTYKFQVVNILLSLHTFNPSKSVLSRSITVQ